MKADNTISQEVFNDAYKKILLKTFKRTIAFLEEHHIKWCVCGGTCLGAVRHHNIIPWDDDVDIFVPRDDYERLFTIRKGLEKYQLSMSALEDGYGYCYGMTKIFDSDTTLWEIKEYPYLSGVYIDVFPIERSNIETLEMVKLQKQYRKAKNIYQFGLCSMEFSDFVKLFRGFHLKTVANRLVNMLSPHDRQREYNQFLHSTRLVPYTPDGKYMMCIMGSYWEREHCPSEWFAATVEMPFSDFMVRLPVGYDNYLRQLYGNYMELPPKEERVTHHYHYYCNFRERLSMNEVKKRIRMGEYCVV